MNVHRQFQVYLMVLHDDSIHKHLREFRGNFIQGSFQYESSFRGYLIRRGCHRVHNAVAVTCTVDLMSSGAEKPHWRKNPARQTKRREGSAKCRFRLIPTSANTMEV